MKYTVNYHALVRPYSPDVKATLDGLLKTRVPQQFQCPHTDSMVFISGSVGQMLTIDVTNGRNTNAFLQFHNLGDDGGGHRRKSAKEVRALHANGRDRRR